MWVGARYIEMITWPVFEVVLISHQILYEFWLMMLILISIMIKYLLSVVRVFVSANNKNFVCIFSVSCMWRGGLNHWYEIEIKNCNCWNKVLPLTLGIWSVSCQCYHNGHFAGWILCKVCNVNTIKADNEWMHMIFLQGFPFKYSLTKLWLRKCLSFMWSAYKP